LTEFLLHRSHRERWCVTLEERGLGSSSIIIRIPAIGKLAVAATDCGRLAPGTRPPGMATPSARRAPGLRAAPVQAARRSPTATSRGGMAGGASWRGTTAYRRRVISAAYGSRSRKSFALLGRGPAERIARIAAPAGWPVGIKCACQHLWSCRIRSVRRKQGSDKRLKREGIQLAEAGER